MGNVQGYKFELVPSDKSPAIKNGLRSLVKRIELSRGKPIFKLVIHVYTQVYVLTLKCRGPIKESPIKIRCSHCLNKGI